MLHTILYRKLNGKLVGRDFHGNTYYEERVPLYSKNKRRWVVYKDNRRDGSLVPAMWHGWLHHLVDEVPEDAFFDLSDDKAKLMAEKFDTQNKTGTKQAHSAINSDDKITTYRPWTPTNDK